MTDIIGQDTGAPGAIVESSTQTFVADVVDASMELPVIVDFWAPWCEPCKTLGPLLEKIVNAAQGKVKLVKVDIDQNQEIAMQMRIQSIPAVFAFKSGQPVDGFVGAQSESQIKSFVERLTGPIGPTPVEQALEQAQAALEEEDFNSAANIYSQVLKHAPDEAAAVAGMARSMTISPNMPMWRAPGRRLSSPSARRNPATERMYRSCTRGSKPTPTIIRRATISPWPITPRRGTRKRSTSWSRSSAASALGTKRRRAKCCCRFSTRSGRPTSSPSAAGANCPR